MFAFGLVPFLICGALAVYLFTQANEFKAMGAASEAWTAAPGKVVVADYKTRRSRRRTVAEIDVRYTFDVNGQNYSGSTLAFEKLDSLAISDAERRLQPYPVGAACQVFYDPEDPSRNVLEKGEQSSNTGLMLSALAILIGGFVILYDGVAGGINALRFPQTGTG